MEHGTLQVRFKGQVLQSVTLDRPVLTIGRLKENDVVIDNLSVSRLHARILLEGERVFLEDQGSGNGCLVNGRRVDRAPIAPGDEILIGKHELVLLSPGEASGSDDAAGSEGSGSAGQSPWDGAHTYFLPQDDALPKEEERVERHAGLIVQRRGELERVVSVEQTPFVIGRAPECDLVLEESGVSRRHARILLEDDDFVLEDLGGVNGTFVAGEPAGRRVLEIGDEIALDVYRITFVLEDRPIAEEIHVASRGGASRGTPDETAFAETGPPGGSVISDEGSMHASVRQDLGASGPCDVALSSTAAPAHDVGISGGSAATSADAPECAAEAAVESTLVTGGPLEPDPACEEVVVEVPASGLLTLELEVEPDALPEALRDALLAARDADLVLPVRLRLRRG